MKYIFIDSNQYRHIFSQSEGFSDSIYNLLLKLIDNDHIKLLVPKQTKDEVERDRLDKWPNNDNSAIENKIQQLLLKKEKLLKDYEKYDCKKVEKCINKEIGDLQKQKGRITKSFLNLKSRQNQKLKKLFSTAIVIDEDEKLLIKADFRHKKGNPPYDANKDENKFGDALIWESILSYLQGQKKHKPDLIFVSSDKTAWGRDGFSDWLKAEFKRETNGKVTYSKLLSDIPGLTQEEQTALKIKERQELKENAVNDYVNSSSFINAGDNAQKLLSFKKLLTDEDYKKIFVASLNNHEIYQSFFTPAPVRLLFNDGKGYVVKALEKATSAAWEKFKQYYTCDLKRQSDELAQKDEMHVEDIPF